MQPPFLIPNPGPLYYTSQVFSCKFVCYLNLVLDGLVFWIDLFGFFEWVLEEGIQMSIGLWSKQDVEWGCIYHPVS